MRKSILKFTSVFAALAIGSAALPSVTDASAEKGANIIGDNDPGFESRTVSSAALTNSAWGDNSWISRGTAYTDNTHAHSGLNSVKVSGKATGARAVVTGLTEGKKYWISGWVYTTEGGKHMRMGLQGNGGTAYTTDRYLTVNGWTQLCGVVTAPPAGDAAVKGTTGITDGWALFVNVENGSIGDFWVDDFEICEITSDATTEESVAGNIVGANAGFESGNMTDWRSDDSAPKTYVINSSPDANSGNYSAYTTRRTANYASPQIYFEGSDIMPDTYYYASAMVRQGSYSENEIKAVMTLQKETGSVTNIVPNNYTAINDSSYTKVESIIKNVDATKVKLFVSTNEASGSEGSLVNLWTDDYVLAPITASVANGAEGITPNSEITFNIPESITVDAGAFSINNGAEVANVVSSGMTHTVSFDGMLADTEYTVTLNTGLNINPSWTFKTESKNILTSYDSGFENGAIDTSKWNLSKGAEGGVSRVETRSNSGRYSAFVYGRDYEYNGPQAKDIPLEAGAKYYACAYVYTDADMTGRMTLQGTTSSRTTPVNLKAGEWTKIEGMLEAPDSVAKLFVQTSGTADIYVDDMELYKASTITVSSPVDGEEDVPVDSDITLVFSDVVNLTESNLSIDNGSILGVHTTDNITYTVDVETLSDFTTYKLTIKNLFDSNYDRVEDAEISFTTASAIPGAVRNMLSSYDPGFENGSINTAKWNLSGAVERIAGGRDSSYAAKSIAKESYRGPQAKFIGLTEGDQYYVSAWVRSNVDGQNAHLCLQGASAVRTASVELAADEWKQISGVITVPAPDASTTSYDYRLYVNTGDRFETEEVYFDDFFMTPYVTTAVTSSSPADGATDVRLRDVVSVTFNNTLDETQTLADKFTINGATVADAVLQADKKTVVLTTDSIFDEYTEYAVTASGITDQFGEIIADSAFTFTTGGGLCVTESAVFTRGDSALEELTAGTVNITAKVANDGLLAISKPVMIVTVYDAEGFLIDVEATDFGEMLAGGTPATLSKNITVGAEAESVTVHIWKAANNVSYMSTPVTLSVAD